MPRTVGRMPRQRLAPALPIDASVSESLRRSKTIPSSFYLTGKPAFFGSYRYGSPLLNVTFDPGLPGEAGLRSRDPRPDATIGT